MLAIANQKPETLNSELLTIPRLPSPSDFRLATLQLTSLNLKL